MPCRICPGCEGPYPGPPRSGIAVQPEGADVKADRRYYVNADRSRVVEEGDPEAALLLAAEGDDITNEDVARYGLGKAKAADPEPVVVHSIAADPQPQDEAPADAKAVSEPAENKARTMRAGKADEGK